jgi:hypothetical protein
LKRGGGYWLGLWKDHRPGPEDLQRQDLADGLPVKLLDGNQWVVAIADYLPKLFRLDRATGEQKLQPLPADMPFIEKTNALFEYLTGDEFHGTLEETMTVMIPNGLTYAAEALSKNYRVNFDLLEMLRVVGQLEAVKIAGVATGLELMARRGEQKKSALLAATSADC